MTTFTLPLDKGDDVHFFTRIHPDHAHKTPKHDATARELAEHEIAVVTAGVDLPVVLCEDRSGKQYGIMWAPDRTTEELQAIIRRFVKEAADVSSNPVLYISYGYCCRHYNEPYYCCVCATVSGRKQGEQRCLTSTK